VKVLFICNVNANRSPTAEELFSPRYITKSAGLDKQALNPLGAELLVWADLVVVMEEWMRKEIGKRFPRQYLKKKIISLDIPDIYRYNQPELQVLLKKKMRGIK